MRSVVYLALSGIAALAAAQTQGVNPFLNPPGGYQFKAGVPTDLKWNPTTSGTVSLRLQSGNHISPSTGQVIASGISNDGSFVWTPKADLANRADYTVEILDDSTGSYNFLPRFSINGATSMPASGSGPSMTQTSVPKEPVVTSMPTKAPTNTMHATTMGTAAPTRVMGTTMVSSSARPSSSKAVKPKPTGTVPTSTSEEEEEEISSPAKPKHTSAGVANRVPGGLVVLAIGAAAVM